MKLNFSKIRRQLEVARLELAEFEAVDATLSESQDWLRVALRAFVVASLYSGMERILERVAQDLDHPIHSGRNWHSLLLAEMTAAGPQNLPVISPETHTILDDLRRFRHVVHHHHATELDQEGVDRNLGLVRRALPLFEADMLRIEALMLAQQQQP